MNNKEIANRLKTLGLQELLPEIEEQDLPFPLPRRRILRMLEIAATKFADKSTEIMALHQDIVKGIEHAKMARTPRTDP
jgi:hypothetical protein